MTRNNNIALEVKNSNLIANAEAVNAHNSINNNVYAVLMDEFIIKDCKYYSTIENAIETLKANKLVIDGFDKFNYDKDCAIKELEMAKKAYTSFREHINCAIEEMEQSGVALSDVMWED